MRHIFYAMAVVAGICLTGFTAKAQEEEQEMQPPLFLELAHNFKVTGTPCVQTFVEALPVYSKEYGWYNDPEIDNKNGYFEYGEEGSGGLKYYAALWRTTDGKRLFIFSYRQSEWNSYEGRTERFTRHSGSPYYYSSVEIFMGGENEDQMSFIDYDTGFAAYIYNEATHTLEFLPEPPIKGWKAKEAHRLLLVPQHGKDITVEEGFFEENPPTYVLKWNGAGFDCNN